MLLPAVLRGVSEFEQDRAISVECIEIAIIYLMESVSYFIWITTFIFLVKRSHKINKNIYWVKISEKFMLVILLLYLFFSFNAFLEVFGSDSLFDDRLQALLLFEPLAKALGPILACFGLAYYKWENRNKFLFLFVLFVYSVFIVISVVSGIRGLIVHSLFFLLFMFFVFGKKKLVVNVSLLLIIFAMFQSYYMSIRHLDVGEKVEMLADGNIGNPKKSLIVELEFRYGEPSRLSVAFLRRGMNSNFAGITPLESSLYAPLPSAYFPEKPIPGSVGKDKYSMGMYLINSDLRGEWWNMTEFFPSAHSYWEFGVVGVILVSVISSTYISILAILLLRFHLLSIPFLLLFFKPWGYNEMKIWLYEIPLQVFQYILPSLLLMLIIILISKLKFRKIALSSRRP